MPTVIHISSSHCPDAEPANVVASISLRSAVSSLPSRFNSLTHETTYTDPSEHGGYEFSPRPHPVGASPLATPFSGPISPTYGHAAATTTPGNDMMHGFMPPAGNGYISQPGSVCISPREFHHQYQHRHLHQQHLQNDYPAETRYAEGDAGRGVSYRSQPPQNRQQEGRRIGARAAPFGQATTSIELGGYRWEECYTQIDGKKFWRHKETGVILTKDPYR